MNIESAREYCLSLPLVTECFPFDETTLVFKVIDKMFAVLSLDDPDRIVLKCEPEHAIELREKYSEIEGAWHFNKKYWNQLDFSGSLTDDLIKELIRHSYAEVVKKMPLKTRKSYPEITDVTA